MGVRLGFCTSVPQVILKVDWGGREYVIGWSLSIMRCACVLDGRWVGDEWAGKGWSSYRGQMECLIVDGYTVVDNS